MRTPPLERIPLLSQNAVLSAMVRKETKPAFEHKDWLSTDALFFLTAFVEKHYTVMAYDPDRNAIPVLEDQENWIYIYIMTRSSLV